VYNKPVDVIHGCLIVLLNQDIMNRAALIVQSGARVFLARLRVVKLRAVKESDVNQTIENERKQYEGVDEQKITAAKTIQFASRSFAARLKVKQAASIAANHVEADVKAESAATLIQRCLRIHLAKQMADNRRNAFTDALEKELEEERRQIEDGAATLIQRKVRDSALKKSQIE
jgi:hypothetical protein